MRIILTSPLFPGLQVACVGGQEDGSHDGCVPGFQVKHYHVTYSGPFQKDQPLVRGQYSTAHDCVVFFLCLELDSVPPRLSLTGARLPPRHFKGKFVVFTIHVNCYFKLETDMVGFCTTITT